MVEECVSLKEKWGKYMADPRANYFPSQRSFYLNFTGYIMEDMETFLTAYAASFPTITSNTTLWENTAKKVFKKTLKELYNQRNDKLIMDCVFQKSLFSHKPNIPSWGLLEGCPDFHPTLTSNGLCYSFNGMGTSNVWKSTLSDTDILKSFSKVFGTTKKQTKKFRGIGDSEGK